MSVCRRAGETGRGRWPRWRGGDETSPDPDGRPRARGRLRRHADEPRRPHADPRCHPHHAGQDFTQEGHPFTDFISNPDPDNAISVGSLARLDATAKDEAGKETNGLGSIAFYFSDESLVKIAGGNGPQQRRLRVLKPGRLVIWTELDGIQSNQLTLHFTN